MELGAAIDAISGEIPGRRVTTSLVGRLPTSVKFAFPQDPTHAVSAMRALMKQADTQSGQSNLERPQDIAVVGQTVPLMFCNRHEWGLDGLGQELGENGGHLD